MKEFVCTVFGTVGGFFVMMIGGVDAALFTMITLMIIDYLSWILVAGVFKNSPKTENGALESKTGFKGLVKKGMCLLIVVVAVRLDIIMNTSYIRSAVIIGFSLNELISIVENAGLMGIPLPDVLLNAIELLKKKEGNNADSL